MTILDYPTEVLQETKAERPEIAHVHCCRRVDLALCGEDLAGHRPATAADPDCPTCDDLDETAQLDNVCPVDKTHCPYDRPGKCSVHRA